MNKQIIFTVLRGEYGIYIKSKSLLVDTEDREIKSVACNLLGEMRKLTKKYNARNIAVLFEID